MVFALYFIYHVSCCSFSYFKNPFFRMTVLDPVPSLGRDPQELAEEVRGKMLEELKRDFESQQKRKKKN